MASDKYDAFPQAIIILLLDLFLVCRWQQPQRCMPRLHSGKEREKKGAVETRGHRLERYTRVYGEAERNQNPKRRTANSRVCFASSPSAPPYPTLSFFLSLSLLSFSSHLFTASLRGPSTTEYQRRCHHRDTDYKLHSICNEVHLFWRPTLVAPGSLGSVRF